MSTEAAQLVIGFFTLVLVPLVGWLLKREIHAVESKAQEGKELAIRALDRLNDHKLHTAEKYVSREHFDTFESRLFSEIGEIKDRLDRKADRRSSDN